MSTDDRPYSKASEVVTVYRKAVVPTSKALRNVFTSAQVAIDRVIIKQLVCVLGVSVQIIFVTPGKSSIILCDTFCFTAVNNSAVL